jgi:hypothetical protein
MRFGEQKQTEDSGFGGVQELQNWRPIIWLGKTQKAFCLELFLISLSAVAVYFYRETFS